MEEEAIFSNSHVPADDDVDSSSSSAIMRLPNEILVSIGDIQERQNPEQLVESTKVNSYWNGLHDERSTVNALLRLMSDLCAYLPKTDLWRLRLVNAKISATLSRMLDYAIGNSGDGETDDAENRPLPLRWRVIPTLVVTAETFAVNNGYHHHRLTSLLSDIERLGRLQLKFRRWCPISTSVLCKSMDVKFVQGDDEVKNHAMIDFLRVHGHVVSDLRLRVTDRSIKKTRAAMQRLIGLFRNVRRLELFAYMFYFEYGDPEFLFCHHTYKPDPQVNPPSTLLPKLEHVLFIPVSEMFKPVDKRNGYMNHVQFRSWLSCLGYIPRIWREPDPEFESILDTVDPNRKGHLSFQEILAFFVSVETRHPNIT